MYYRLAVAAILTTTAVRISLASIDRQITSNVYFTILSMTEDVSNYIVYHNFDSNDIYLSYSNVVLSCPVLSAFENVMTDASYGEDLRPDTNNVLNNN